MWFNRTLFGALALSACLAQAADPPKRTVEPVPLINNSKATWRVQLDGGVDTTVGGLEILLLSRKSETVLTKRAEFYDLKPGGLYYLNYTEPEARLWTTKAERAHHAFWSLVDHAGNRIELESYRTGAAETNVFVKVLKPDPMDDRQVVNFRINDEQPGAITIKADTVNP